MTRLLHLADVHLDRPFAGLAPEAARARRRDVQTTFERCIAMASERDCDAITIGGDLWEDEHVTANTCRSLASTLEGFGNPVLVIAGNHDRLLPGGHWERTPWPSNVHLFRGSEVTARELADDVLVWGISWQGGPLSANFLADFRAPEGRINLLLLHGSERQKSAFQQGGHCPFAADAIATAGFDYCLAGHYHRASETGRVVYPGSPEPLGWGETGAHGVAIVEIDGGQVSVETVATNTLRYLERQIDCEGCASSTDVLDRVRSALDDESPDRVCLSLELTGELEPECHLDREELLDHVGEDYAALRIAISTTFGYDFDELAAEQTVRGHFVRRISHRIETASNPEEKRRGVDARLAGLRALDGRKDILDVG
jgi:DNA repair exonuclease SbcCD nuclease subunit